MHAGEISCMYAVRHISVKWQYHQSLQFVLIAVVKRIVGKVGDSLEGVMWPVNDSVEFKRQKLIQQTFSRAERRPAL